MDCRSERDDGVQDCKVFFVGDETISLRGGGKMKVLIEAVIIVAVIYIAVRMFRRRG